MSSITSGFDPDRFELNISQDYKCTICFGVLRDACKLTCNHCYCRVCITRWLEDNQICPIDRQRAAISSIQIADKSIRSTLEKYKLKCTYWPNGCRKVVTYKDVDNHERTCTFNPSNNEPAGVTINVTILINNARNIIINCSPNDTVRQLKHKIYDEERIQVEEQNLIFSGKVLSNDKTLIDYQIKNNSFLFFTETYTGGI